MPDTEIRKLIDQMPSTDKELAAATENSKPAAVENKEPNNKSVAGPTPASKFTGPDPATAQRIFEQLLAGGRASLAELLHQTRVPPEPDFDHYKAAYLLHGLIVHVGRAEKETDRRLLAELLAAEISNEKLTNARRGFLIRELQWIGDRAVVAALGKCLANEQLCADAAATLMAIRDGAPEQFRRALEKSKGKCRLIIVQSLAVLGDAEAKASLRQALAEEDQDIRLAAAWGLARLGDETSADSLLRMADKAEGYARNKATQACLLLAEQLIAKGQRSDAGKIYSHLRDTRTDPSERYLRDIATKALAAAGV